MIKIVVLTNQQLCLNQIKQITERSLHLSDIPYKLKEYQQPQDLFDDLSEYETDSIFLLDMEMWEHPCFEVTRRIKTETIHSRIIYITNQVEYAPEAFESNPYRYILKKQMASMLPKAYRACCEKIVKQKTNFLYSIQGHNALSVQISYQEIYYLKKERKSTWIVCKNRKFKEEKPFEKLLKDFIENPYYSIISKNCVVNILHVMSFKKCQIYLRDGSILFVDKKHGEQFLKDILKCYQ